MNLQSEKGAPLCRASLFTFVIWTEKGPSEAMARSMIDKMSLRFPARVLLIIDEPERKDIQRETSALVREGVISDFIQIYTPPHEVPRVLSIIIPLLLSDLPAFLFIAKSFSPRDVNLETFLISFNRILVDLTLFESPATFIQELNSLPERIKSAFFEVNWAKSKGWRHAFARIFDSNERIAILQKTRFLYIRYRVKSHDDPPHFSALLLQGWIAEKLGWEFRDWVTLAHQREKLLYLAQGEELAVELEGVFEEAEEEDLLSLDITTWEEQFFSFSKISGKNQLQIHISDMESCELPQTLPLETYFGSFRFFRALFYEPHDPAWTKITLS